MIRIFSPLFNRSVHNLNVDRIESSDPLEQYETKTLVIEKP